MSSPIKLMINGLPGNVAQIILRHANRAADMDILPFSLTGTDIQVSNFSVEGLSIRLVKPETRESVIREIKSTHGEFISVDFTHPAAVNDNARFYSENNLPFVMGTTGGDREALLRSVGDSKINAVIAPNMAKPIVGLQAMMAYAAENFPGLFDGYSLTLTESHQQGKADTSGTAKAMVRHFNQMGIAYNTKEIVKIRDPEVQRESLGIPEDYITGHAWHTYTLRSPDNTVRLEFRHDINGREVYGDGTLDAIRFLAKKTAAGDKGHVFNMIDVLKSDV